MFTNISISYNKQAKQVVLKKRCFHVFIKIKTNKENRNNFLNYIFLAKQIFITLLVVVQRDFSLY